MMRGEGRFPQNKADGLRSRRNEAGNTEEDCTGFCFTCDLGDKSRETCTTVRIPVIDSEGFCGPDG